MPSEAAARAEDSSADPAVADTAEILVMVSCAIRAALEALGPIFARRAGVRVRAPYDPSSVVSRKLAAGARFDVAIANVETVDALAARGIDFAEPRRVFASTHVALGFARDFGRPDVTTRDALRAVVTRARSISYSDPALGGGSSNYFAAAVEEMGMGAHVRAKAITTLPGEAAFPIGEGRADICVAQASEIALVEGVGCVPIFPDAPKSRTVYAAGVSAASARREAARAFVAFLLTEEARAIMEARGMRAP